MLDDCRERAFKKLGNRAIRQSLTLAAAALAIATNAQAALPHAVALTKGAAPGLDGGQFSFLADGYTLAGDGWVAFSGNVAFGTSLSQTAAAYRYSPARGLEYEVSLLEPLPGDGRDVINLFSGPHVSQSGKVAIVGEIDPAYALFAGTPTSFEVVALSTDDAPGLPGIQFHPDRPFTELAASSESVVVSEVLIGDGLDNHNSQGVWIWTGTTLEFLFRTGDPAVGIEHQFFSGLPLTGRVNRRGTYVFQATFMAPDQRAIWVGSSSDDLQLVLKDGDMLPDGSVAHVAPSELYVTDDDDLVIGLRATGVGHDSVLVGKPGHLVQLTVVGAHLPGMPESSTVASIDGVYASAGGRIAVTATASDSSSTLLAGDQNGLHVVDPGGQTLRGTGEQRATIGGLQINDQGQIAADITVTNSAGQMRTALYRYSPGFGFDEIIGPDGLITDDAGEQAVRYFSDHCGPDSSACLDDAGRVAFAVQLADGRKGIALSDPQAVGPEDLGEGGAAGAGTGGTAEAGGAPSAGEAGAAGGALEEAGSGGDLNLAGAPAAGSAGTATAAGGKAGSRGGAGEQGAGRSASSPTASNSDSGCGCAVPKRTDDASLIALLSALFGVAGRRRRCRRPA